MRLEINRLTESQKALLKSTIGKGIWDHITTDSDVPQSIINLICERLCMAGYPVKRSLSKSLMEIAFFNKPEALEQ